MEAPTTLIAEEVLVEAVLKVVTEEEGEDVMVAAEGVAVLVIPTIEP